jgi:hypothetical protein
MKLTRSFTAGSVSAVALTAATLPGLTPSASTALQVIGALSIAFLGHAASDCPPNCPGTDRAGRPEPINKNLLMIALLLFGTAALMAIFTGCTAPNPEHTADAPDKPAYVVAPALTATSNTAAVIAPVVGTVTGTGPLLPLAVNAVFGIIGAISLAYARHQNQTAAQLAAAVATTGHANTGAVLAAAADATKFATIAGLLNSALPAGQAPGALPPPGQKP